MIQVLVQHILAPTTVKVDINTHAGFIEQVQQLVYRTFIPSPAKKFAQVIMCIDHRETRGCHVGRWDD